MNKKVRINLIKEGIDYETNTKFLGYHWYDSGGLYILAEVRNPSVREINTSLLSDSLSTITFIVPATYLKTFEEVMADTSETRARSKILYNERNYIVDSISNSFIDRDGIEKIALAAHEVSLRWMI